MNQIWRALAVAALLLGSAAPAGAAQICGWLKETLKPDDEHAFELWLKSDARAEFLYKVGGTGVVTKTGKSHSPASATYSLDPGKAEKVWGFGTTVDAPGKVDISVELHQMPADIFSDAPTPLLATFTFRREIPEGEKTVPPDLAKPQCAEVRL